MTSLARADEAAVKGVHEAVAKTGRALNDGCPARAKELAADMDAKFAALSELDRDDPLQREVESIRKAVGGALANWSVDNVKAALDGCLFGAKEAAQGSNVDMPEPDERFDRCIQGAADQMADEINKGLLPAADVTAYKDKLEAVKADYRKMRLRTTLKTWREPGESSDEIKVDGWEQETALDIAVIAEGWGHDLGCEKSAAVARHDERWLNMPFVASALARYPDSADLIKLRDQVTAQRERAVANVKKIHEQVLTAAEKLPPGKSRDQLLPYYKGQIQGATTPWKKNGPNAPEVCDPRLGDEGLIERMQALVALWEKGNAQARDERQAYLDKLVAAADEAWPGISGQWKIEKLAATEALEKSDAWKGKAVKVTAKDVAGASYERTYGLVVEMDGVPVCGVYDDELLAAGRDFQTKTGVAVGNYQEVIGLVDGTCKVWERVRDPHDSSRMIRGRSIDGVKLRIVAYKTRMIAVGVGHGTSLDKVQAITPGRSDGSSSSAESEGASPSVGRGGTLHMIHRLVAWAMSGVLLLAGAIALAHGLSRFVPKLQEQRAKLGTVPGSLGIALALVGIAWFGAAAVLPFLSSEVRFGSLPAVALGLAGVALALDLARAKGKLEEKTALTLQPIAIFFGGVSCVFALVHVFGWDLPLL